MKTMNKKRILKGFLCAAVIFLSVALDRVTKNAAVSFFENEGDSVTAIPGLLNFTYVLNEGATAGMLSDHRWVFMSISAVALVAIAAYMIFAKKLSTFTGVSLSLIVGGGIGNMIDRVGSGAVVDFFDVTAVNFYPFNCIFNVADVFVCVGCAMLIVSFIIEDVRDRRSEKENSGGAEEHS